MATVLRLPRLHSGPSVGFANISEFDDVTA